MADFLPRQEGALLAWSRNFSDAINASPLAYGVSVELAAEFAGLYEAFAEAMKTTPEQRSMVSVAGKNAAKAQMIALARRLSMLVKANADVTADQRINLGLNAGRARTRQLPAPPAPPSVQIVGASGNSAEVVLSDSEVTRLGKPKAVLGATVFTFVGEQFPADRSQWTFYATTTARRLTVHFDQDVPPGAQVWICACWLNPRLEPGPASVPRCTRLPGGGVGTVAAGMKQAA